MIKSWSYSRYNVYQQCPFKAKLLYVEGLKEPTSPAMSNGIKVHKQLEYFLNWEVEQVPSCGSMFADQLYEIRMQGAEAEQEWAFKQDWTPCGWKDPDVWLRMKLDASVLSTIDKAWEITWLSPDSLNKLDRPATGKLWTCVDFKTGQPRMDHSSQLELYVLAAMKQGVVADQYVTENWYVDHGKATGSVFTPAQEQDLQRKWEKAVFNMMNDTKFEPRQNQYCRYCHFSAAKGGPCQY